MIEMKTYDMKVLTDEQVEFETSEFVTTIQRIIEIVENMSHEKLVCINRVDEEETTTWCLIHTNGLHEEILSLCHIDEETPTTIGDKLHMCHILFTLLSSGNYGLDDGYFEKE